jgi:redox-sensitive bicupin YhaK (pirin superfamily)
VQIWIALPKSEELCAPSFSHHPAQTLPEIDLSGARVRILIGQAYGASAPTQTFSPTLYMHVRLDAGASLPIEAKYEERAVYAIDSQIRVDGERLNTCEMAILPEGRDTEVRAEAAAQFMVLGGAPLDGPRRIDWNFVSSSSELIDQARQSWKNFPNEQFGLVPDETEWIPLPQ